MKIYITAECETSTEDRFNSKSFDEIKLMLEEDAREANDKNFRLFQISNAPPKNIESGYRNGWNAAQKLAEEKFTSANKQSAQTITTGCRGCKNRGTVCDSCDDFSNLEQG